MIVKPMRLQLDPNVNWVIQATHWIDPVNMVPVMRARDAANFNEIQKWSDRKFQVA